MSSYNKVILIGRLTRDPEMRYTTSGKPVASFTLAVDRKRSSQGGEKETDFLDCVVWQQTAEFASKYATKGRMVCVEGRLQIRTWEDKDSGQKRKAAEVICTDLSLLDKREDAQPAAAAAPAAQTRRPSPPQSNGSNYDEDIPF